MDVFSSDIIDRGAGAVIDFLGDSHASYVNHIITNPPYCAAEAFVREAMKWADRKVAMLLRLAFLEGAGRAEGLFKEHPISRVHVFSERVTMYKPGADAKKNGGTTAYAWFVWDKSYTGPTTVHHIPPGTRAKRDAGFRPARVKKPRGDCLPVLF